MDQVAGVGVGQAAGQVAQPVGDLLHPPGLARQQWLVALEVAQVPPRPGLRAHELHHVVGPAAGGVEVQSPDQGGVVQLQRRQHLADEPLPLARPHVLAELKELDRHQAALVVAAAGQKHHPETALAQENGEAARVLLVGVIRQGRRRRLDAGPPHPGLPAGAQGGHLRQPALAGSAALDVAGHLVLVGLEVRPQPVPQIVVRGVPGWRLAHDSLRSRRSRDAQSARRCCTARAKVCQLAEAKSAPAASRLRSKAALTLSRTR